MAKEDAVVVKSHLAVSPSSWKKTCDCRLAPVRGICLRTPIARLGGGRPRRDKHADEDVPGYLFRLIQLAVGDIRESGVPRRRRYFEAAPVPPRAPAMGGSGRALARSHQLGSQAQCADGRVCDESRRDPPRSPAAAACTPARTGTRTRGHRVRPRPSPCPRCTSCWTSVRST